MHESSLSLQKQVRTSKTFRKYRYSYRKSDTSYPDGIVCLMRSFLRTVALRQPPLTEERRPEDLLYDTGCGKTADIYYLCQWQRTWCIFLCEYLKNKIGMHLDFRNFPEICWRGEKRNKSMRTYYLSCYRLCMRAFSDRLYCWKSPQDEYQRAWLVKYQHWMPSGPAAGAITLLGRLPEVCTGFNCDREWFMEIPWMMISFQLLTPLCSIGMYPRPHHFSDFYGDFAVKEL